MKSITDWLQDLPEPYRSQALENHKNGRYPNTMVNTLKAVLSAGFIWSQTNQGISYWQSVFLFCEREIENIPESIDLTAELEAVKKGRDELKASLRICLTQNHLKNERIVELESNKKERDRAVELLRDAHQFIPDSLFDDITTFLQTFKK